MACERISRGAASASNALTRNLVEFRWLLVIRKDQETLINRFQPPLSGVRSELSAILSRSSAHFSKPSRAGQRACPHFVKRYSTFGGTCQYLRFGRGKLLAARQALFDAAELRAGQTVVIHVITIGTRIRTARGQRNVAKRFRNYE